jgi:hypothetical protein
MESWLTQLLNTVEKLRVILNSYTNGFFSSPGSSNVRWLLVLMSLESESGEKAAKTNNTLVIHYTKEAQIPVTLQVV